MKDSRVVSSLDVFDTCFLLLCYFFSIYKFYTWCSVLLGYVTVCGIPLSPGSGRYVG